MTPIQPIARVIERREQPRALPDRRKRDLRLEKQAQAGANQFLELFKAELVQRGATLDTEA